MDEIHGDKSQNYRIKALESFRNRKIQVLVATDVAARGTGHITCLACHQLPGCRRIWRAIFIVLGRTGRAGASGKALTFIN
ncbi:MAG: hypothetical protein MZV63_32360 [Marinilabiliales bacterium]|nr:hypothetical protein [Marinilabiliales bacterium]